MSRPCVVALIRPATPRSAAQDLAPYRVSASRRITGAPVSARRPSASTLGGAKRIVGRVDASAIASVSRSSFLCAFTYGRTYSGGISRTWCPCASAADEVGTTARLHRRDTSRQLGQKRRQAVARDP